MQLFHASRQWSERPADERFSSLQSLHDACAGYRQVAGVATVPYRDIRVAPAGDEVVISGPQGHTATLTHWAFGQLAQRAGAPASYLRGLPAPLAAECLQHGLGSRQDAERASILMHQNGGLMACAVTSPDYTRIWNSDITKRLLELETGGTWQPAPAAFDGSRGLYASDHDLFAFLVDDGRRIFEKGPGGGLGRGFFVWNSEVGAASFGVMTFLYEYVCGNHRVWGASHVKELRIRHVGQADARAWRDLTVAVRHYAESSADFDEQRITAAMSHKLGGTKDEVLDAIFRLRLPELSRRRAAEAYELAEKRVDWYGDPRTAWGLAGGITELARDLPYADERVALDRAAGRVMEVAF